MGFPIYSYCSCPKPEGMGCQMMTMLYRTFPLICLIFVGCRHDPTDQFKSFVSKAMENAKTEKIEVEDVSFDVEKTNSTISPFIATIELRYKDNDKTLKNGYESWTHVKLGYVFQEETWVLKTHITDYDLYRFFLKKAPQDLTLHKCFTP
jgi:hypothetical protein